MATTQSSIASGIESTRVTPPSGPSLQVLERARAFADQHVADPSAWHALGACCLHLGRLDEANSAARRAVSLDPRNPATLLLLGQCAVSGGDQLGARAIAASVAQLPLRLPEWHDALGTLYTHCEDPVAGQRCFEHAVSMAPEGVVFRYHLATAQRMTGDILGALSSLEIVLARAPSHVPALYLRSDLCTYDPEHNHVAELSALLARGALPPNAEIMLCFALYKELEDLTRDSEAFDHLERGCALQRKLFPYAVQSDIDTMGQLVLSHDDIVTSRNEAEIGSECIFVFGLPRSGTTLVDRIVGTHPWVHSNGESQAFPVATIKAAGSTAARGLDKARLVEVARGLDPRPLANAYLATIRLGAGGAVRCLDKQPLNYLYAALIARALPGARLVLVMRDPRDACFAMYKTLFAGAYPFSYDLTDLGRYFAAWHGLMRHWKALLGDRLLVVEYEDLVMDPGNTTSKILEHCGLPWDRHCLQFHENPSAVMTASAVQVRRGIYRSSLGKWCRFEQQLQPLINVLRDHVPRSGWRLA